MLSVVTGLAWLAPQTTRACSLNPCWFGSPRIGTIDVLSVSPVPRDGAFVFTTDQEDSPTCLDKLVPNLTNSVIHNGAGVPGELVQFSGVPELLIWRPATLLDHGVYEVNITVDRS